MEFYTVILLGNFYAVGRENADEFGLKFVGFNAEGQADWLLFGAFHENKNDFLDARMKVTETTNFGKLFVVFRIFN